MGAVTLAWGSRTMKTISVLSRKGGAGKTTVSVNLGLAAMQAGLRVVVADVDPLHSAAEVLRGRPEAGSLLIETTARKLSLLQDACVANRCDLLIIDTPTAPEADVALAVRAADLCLAVTRPTRLDVAAVRQTIELLRSHRSRALLVLNQCPPARGGVETDLVEQAVEALQDAGIPLAATRLRSGSAYQRALAENQSVTEWQPDGAAAAGVFKLLAEARHELEHPRSSSELIARLRADLNLEAAAAGPVQLVQNLLRRLPGRGQLAEA
jgi:chromosome partitioning protein